MILKESMIVKKLCTLASHTMVSREQSFFIRLPAKLEF